jgi:hypothetical protein
VLVVIGLIVGGVLTGQSLISAAEVRAQLTQIEKFNSAVNTFKGKFNYLPGDIVLASAQQFGFTTDASCLGTVGARNGDGLVTAWSGADFYGQAVGETGYFWQDLSSTAAGRLIEGAFPSNGAPAIICGGYIPVALTTTPGASFIGDYLPAAKIGNGNYLYVYIVNDTNWYGLSSVTSITTADIILSNANIKVVQAYRIDAKIDDGLPQSGTVQASYVNGTSNGPVASAPDTPTAGGNATSCYDTTTGTYSVTQNNGNGGNCAMSFRFQ